MPDFVAMMADVYLNIEMPATEDVGVTMAAAVVEAVEKSGTITAEVDGRIRKVK